jgi:hypothetical protein
VETTAATAVILLLVVQLVGGVNEDVTQSSFDITVGSDVVADIEKDVDACDDDDADEVPSSLRERIMLMLLLAIRQETVELNLQIKNRYNRKKFA